MWVAVSHCHRGRSCHSPQTSLLLANPLKPSGSDTLCAPGGFASSACDLMILLSMYVGVRSPQLPSCAQVAGPCFNDFLRHWLGGLLTRSRRLGRRNSPGWTIPRVRLPPHCAGNGAHACLPRTQNRASGAVHRSGPPRVVTPAPAHHGDRPLRRLGSDFGVSHLPSRLE